MRTSARAALLGNQGGAALVEEDIDAPCIYCGKVRARSSHNQIEQPIAVNIGEPLPWAPKKSWGFCPVMIISALAGIEGRAAIEGSIPVARRKYKLLPISSPFLSKAGTVLLIEDARHCLRRLIRRFATR